MDEQTVSWLNCTIGPYNSVLFRSKRESFIFRVAMVTKGSRKNEKSILKKILESKVLHGPLWYNSKISTYPLFEAELYKKGIISPIDVLTNTGEIMLKRNMELSYNVSLNFLNYYRLKHCLTRYLKGISLDDNHFVRPFHFSPINMLSKSKIFPLTILRSGKLNSI